MWLPVKVSPRLCVDVDADDFEACAVNGMFERRRSIYHPLITKKARKNRMRFLYAAIR
jgi:hypothetical protein